MLISGVDSETAMSEAATLGATMSKAAAPEAVIPEASGNILAGLPLFKSNIYSKKQICESNDDNMVNNRGESSNNNDTEIDDDEIDSYILSGEEYKEKEKKWRKLHGDDEATLLSQILSADNPKIIGDKLEKNKDSLQIPAKSKTNYDILVNLDSCFSDSSLFE